MSVTKTSLTAGFQTLETQFPRDHNRFKNAVLKNSLRTV